MLLFSASALLLVVAGCGDKLALPSDLPAPDYSGRGIDTTYVQVSPVWTSAGGIDFKRPYDVYVGYDQYIYVCDTKNNRVVKLDLDGTFLGSDSAINPVAITQDRGFDLLMVAGDFATERIDTIFPGTDSMRIDTVTIPHGNAVYRKSYFGSDGFKAVWRTDSPYHPIIVHAETLWVDAEFWGIAASTGIDKQYFVADFLKGRVLRFSSSDLPLPPLVSQEGIGLGMTRYPCDLFYYDIAGQTYVAYAQGAGQLGVQIISPVNGELLFRDTTQVLPPLVRFQANRFKQAAVDEFSNFYVLVDEPDPILGTDYYFYKYDRYGEPLLAFGTPGSGERQFRKPRGLAYHSGVIYIADTNNNRIVRYQLSTEIRQ